MGLFDAVASHVNTAVSLISAKRQADREFKRNKELMRLQYQYQEQAAEKEYQRNLEQWNRENEYNLPINQMQRYQDAGLNPNLIYGNIQSTSASSPQYSLEGSVSAAPYQENIAETLHSSLSQIKVDDILQGIKSYQADDAKLNEQIAESNANIAEAQLKEAKSTNELNQFTKNKDQLNKNQDRQIILDGLNQEQRSKQIAKQTEALQVAFEQAQEQLKQTKFTTEHQQEVFDSNSEEQNSRIAQNKAATDNIYKQLAIQTSKLYLEQETLKLQEKVANATIKKTEAETRIAELSEKLHKAIDPLEEEFKKLDLADRKITSTNKVFKLIELIAKLVK